MVLAALATLWVFALKLISERVLAPVQRGPKLHIFTTRMILLFGLLFGLLTFANVVAFPSPGDGVIAWGLTGFVLVFATVLAIVFTVQARAWHLGLDAACTAEDMAPARALLDLGKPPLFVGYRRWAYRILLAAHRAHELDRDDRAVAWIDGLTLPRLPLRVRLVAEHNRASFALAGGRPDIARAVVAHLPPSTGVAEIDGSLAVLRSLLAILDGDASDAHLDAVQRARRGATGLAADGWAMCEAHLLAARGDTDGARAVLRDLGGRRGKLVLTRIGRHGGPASPLAHRVLTEGPYR